VRDKTILCDSDLFLVALHTCLLLSLVEMVPVQIVTRTLPTSGHFLLSGDARAAKVLTRWRGRRMVITRTRVDCVRYRIACRRVKCLINASLAAHLADLGEDSSKNHPLLWKTVNALLHSLPALTTSTVDWAQTIADYFSNKVFQH